MPVFINVLNQVISGHHIHIDPFKSELINFSELEEKYKDVEYGQKFQNPRILISEVEGLYKDETSGVSSAIVLKDKVNALKLLRSDLFSG